MTERYEAGKAEAKATLEAHRAAASDAQAAITQAAEAKLSKLQLQVCHIHISDTGALCGHIHCAQKLLDH